MNYSTLVQNIKDFMEDDGTEFSNEVDTFIDLTELKLSRELKIPAFRRRQTSSLSTGDPFLTSLKKGLFFGEESSLQGLPLFINLAYELVYISKSSV